MTLIHDLKLISERGPELEDVLNPEPQKQAVVVFSRKRSVLVHQVIYFNNIPVVLCKVRIE